MEEVIKIANNIYNSNITIKYKIDDLLRLDAIQYTNLGRESTKEEKRIVKENSKQIYKIIQELSPEVGDQLIKALDG
jgi:hypothetical protein